MFARLLAFPGACVSRIPWLKSQERQSRDIHVTLPHTCPCDSVYMFVYTCNTVKKLIVSQTNCVFGVGVRLGHRRAGAQEVMSAQWFPNWSPFQWCHTSKKIGVFCLALNVFNFQTMHLIVLFATSLIIHLISQVFSVWNFCMEIITQSPHIFVLRDEMQAGFPVLKSSILSSYLLF